MGVASDAKTDQPVITRVSGGKFAPGVSGNPGGRPSHLKRTIQEMLAEPAHDGRPKLRHLLEKLMAAAGGGDTGAGLGLLDRGYGKPSMAPEDAEVLAPDGAGKERLREILKAFEVE